VVYAVMVETGFNKTEIGKIILAGCFRPSGGACPLPGIRREVEGVVAAPVDGAMSEN
jgi:hypothetical protein